MQFAFSHNFRADAKQQKHNGRLLQRRCVTIDCTIWVPCSLFLFLFLAWFFMFLYHDLLGPVSRTDLSSFFFVSRMTGAAGLSAVETDLRE